MRAVRLAAFEFRRQKTGLQRLTVGFLVLVPLLYGVLYLWSNWDPYGRTDRVPVAVVNNDVPVEVDGNMVSAGDRFAAALRRERTFDWVFTDARDARAGLGDGRYYLVITVPRDFSASLARAPRGSPDRAGIELRVDDSNGYLATIMARVARTEITREVNQAATAAYLAAVSEEIERFRAGLTDARDAARRLRDGTGQQQERATRLVGGLGPLLARSARLTGGAQQVATDSRQLEDAVVPVLGQVADVLPALTNQAAAVRGSSDRLAGLVNAGADTLASRQQGVEDAVAVLGREHPELRGDPAYQRLAERSSAVTQRIDVVSRATAAVNADAQRLSGSARTLPPQESRILARGAASVQRLAASAQQVADDARRLDAGLGDVATTARELDEGAARLHTEAADLTSGLSDAVDQIPALSAEERDRRARILGSPVAVVFTVDHPAKVYGRGLAPFLVAVALWVLGVAAFLVLRPINGRLLAARAGNLTAALAGWLPVFAVGAFGGVVLLGVCEIGLDLDAVHTAWTFGLVLLAVAAFTAIAHLLRLAFGTVGSVLALVLLALQLTACGGRYPVETLPTFLRVLHPYLPMTYLVDGLRVTMTGGNVEPLIRGVIVLAGCVVGAFAITVAVVARRRVWTPTRLHSALVPR